ncbi:hypothetical protein F53441_7460 [Fusarium austroafricanum]|uniref:Uncharacterized protein n=1 Tax=Fusarium austroafricanum TaxID=2364996 RepID=A0A8H4KFM7_9HYPO|nr:hypothetical protein F53441_7460 [Fusarium austroafricanum]
MNPDLGSTSVESTLQELHAYAKLLFLRNGRQFEDKTPYREVEDERFLDQSGNDSDSSKNVSFGDHDVDLLRREFLDRLSETVSSTKGGRHVVASRMFYWPDKVKVFVAINSGFAEGDALSKFLGKLCTSLKDIATAPDSHTEQHMDALWDMLLHHQSSRLNTAMVNLRQLMKDLPHLLPQRSSSKRSDHGAIPDIDGVVLDFQHCLKLLAELLFSDGHSDLERHSSLVSLSHILYRTCPAENFQDLGRVGDKLNLEIGFLGRLQTSFRTLCTAARQLPGFDDLSLIPVARLKTPKKSSSQEWSLVQTFQALKLQLNDTSIDKLMQLSNSKAKWTKNKLVTDFSRLKSPTWEVHAEIQLIFYIISYPGEVANGKQFDYIGCSSWTLPPRNILGRDKQHALLGAEMKVVSWMRKELIGSTITSADYLYQDACDNEIPSDPQVRQDYWFDRCQNKNEESHLFGLFLGLIINHPNPVTREELHQWRSDSGGNPYLVAKIIEKFEEIPKNSLGPYFPWFLRHRTRFELPTGHHSVPRPPSPMIQARNMEDRARKYLAPEDQYKDVQDLRPFAKMHCFCFYSMVLENAHPPPLNRGHCYWFDFGFVVCNDQHEERKLGSLYNKILFGSKSLADYRQSLGSSTLDQWINMKASTCSFDEFWQAWERGKLMAIFNKYWSELTAKNPKGYLQHAESGLLARLRIFLEAQTPRPSIWKLRHFLALEDVSVESAAPEIASAARDYGISERLDTRTTMDLKSLYTQLLQTVEPLEIHGERTKGDLVQFSEQHMDEINPRIRKLLQGL